MSIMSIRRKSAKHAKQLLLGGLLVPAILLTATTAVAGDAVMARKASHSMLLDVTHAGSRLVAVGERGHVLLSDDQGKTWAQKPTPVNQMLTAVNFVSEKSGWAVGHDGHVIASKDGGNTWQLVRPGLQAQAELNEQAVKDAKAEIGRLQALVASGGAAADNLEQTPDMAGMSLEEQLDEVKWQYDSAKDRLREAVVPSPLMDVWFANEKTGYIVGAFGAIFSTKDGGETWLDLSKKIGNDKNYHLNTVIGSTDGSVFVAGEAGFLASSFDGGQTWQQADLGYEGTVFSLLSNFDGSKIIATGLRGNTFVSFDKAKSWTEMNTSVDFSLAGGTLFDGGNVILAGSGGTVTVSLDGGQTFTKHTLPSRSSVSAIVAVGKGHFVMVGQGGVHYFETNVDNNN